MSATIDTLRSAWAPGELPAHRIETLEEEDRIRRWMSGLLPMRFVSRWNIERSGARGYSDVRVLV